MSKMNKIYNKTGIIFGKFYPIHLGHINFIQNMSKEVNTLYVVVCSDTERDLMLFRNSQMPKMPTIEDRITFVKKSFEDSRNIKVIHLNEDGITPYPNGWEQWTKRVEELLIKEKIKIDIIFTNEPQDVENYLKNFKKYMTEKTIDEKLEVRTVDIDRNIYNISATKIRENFKENFKFLPKYVQDFFENKE